MNISQYKSFTEDKYLIPIVGVILFFLVRVFVWMQFDFSADLYGGDSEYYIDVAKNIVNVGEHVSSSGLFAYRAPLYPYFIAGLLNINMELTVYNLYIAQSSLLLVVYLLVFYILQHKKSSVAGVAFLLLCVSPFDAVYNGRVLAENLLSPIVLITISCLMFFYKSKLYGYILPGILIGLLVLTKDVFLLLPVFVSGFMLFRKVGFRYVFIFLLSYVCTISPWVIRNATLPVIYGLGHG